MLMSSPGIVLASSAVASVCLLPVRKPAGSKQRRLSCKATSDDGARVDRRDVLLGLTGVGAAATTSSLGLALAADTTTGGKCAALDGELVCEPRDGFECEGKYEPKPIKEFKPPAENGTKRVRKAAHLLNPDEVAKFKLAFKMMKALPDDDPRSFKRQSDIHQAYCDRHYKLVSKSKDGSGNKSETTPFDVHYSSIFAPWHRMYIYFFEGILGELIGDPTFGLPYWNWDAPEGMKMPTIFADECSPLYDALRNQKRVDKVMDMNVVGTKDYCLPTCKEDDDACRIKNNLVSLYRQMRVDTAEQFYGAQFCNIENNNLKAASAVAGSLENGAHTSAHVWLGDPQNCNHDMGDLSTAARDPVFYSNHCNVDRLWHIYCTEPELKGMPLTDQKLLDTSFVFYNAQKEPVRIKVRDVLDADKLGYTYENVGKLEWMDARPTVAGLQRTTGKKADKVVFKDRTPLKKEERLYLTVDRPNKAQADPGGSSKEAEVLVLDVSFDPCEYFKFSVLVNVPKGQEKKVGPQNSEFAGNCTHVRHGNSSPAGGDVGMKMKGQARQTVSYQFSLREVVEDLKCGKDRQLDITLVPCAGDTVFIEDVRTELCSRGASAA